MKRRSPWSPLLALAALAPLGAGCGSSAGAYPAEDAAAELAAAVCEAALGCCDEGEIHWYYGPVVDADNCVDQLLARAPYEDEGTALFVPEAGDAETWFPNLAALAQAVDEGAIRVNRANLDACVAHLRATACNTEVADPPSESCVPDEPLDVEGALGPCAPHRIFEGQVPAGGACSVGLLWGIECELGHYCISDDGVGGPLIFKDRATDGVCVPMRKLGEACNADELCELGLQCSGIDGTCQPLRGLGEPCVLTETDSDPPADAIALDKCEWHLTCSPFTDTCVADCERGASCYYEADCGEGLVCVKAGAHAYGLCDEPHGLGESCSGNEDCAAGLGCDEPNQNDDVPGECVPLAGPAEPCTLHTDCVSGYCEASTSCGDKVGLGETCAANEQCEEGYCDSTSGECTMHRADGADCTSDDECASGDCNNRTGGADEGTCVSGPVALGDACEDDSHCPDGASCQGPADARTCVALPIAIGGYCDASSECASFLCDGTYCVEGVAIGADCSTDPCDPFTSFCDTEAAGGPVCAPIRETGAPCTRELECRSGDCEFVWDRYLCAPANAPNAILCDGN